METRSKKRKRRRLLQSYVPRRPDLPARFESLDDDMLTKILQFVGRRSYKSFGGLNYYCKEIYLNTKGMMKETFLYGYAPLSVITDKIERAGNRNGWKLYQRVGKGVVYYDRRDIFEWALQRRKKRLSKGICDVAAEEGRTDLLNEVWNNFENNEDYRRRIFRYVGICAMNRGKLNVLKWYETNGFSIGKKQCAETAANRGYLDILKWLREKQGLELDEEFYNYAIKGGHLHVMKWLREQEVPWNDYIFRKAVWNENLDILQWLHEEDCPWPEHYRVRESWLKTEVVEWLRTNGYSDRFY